MKNNLFKLCLFALIAVLYSNCAYAEDDIFGMLASRASTLGTGLKNVGYVIAAFGLIVFSFMAIFNKITWKTLAYIMMSCFILTFMTALITWVASGSSGAVDVSFSDGNGSSELPDTDPTRNPQSR